MMMLTKQRHLLRPTAARERNIAGLYKTCPIDFLRLETDIEPLKDRLLKNDEILFDKYLRLPQADSRRRLVDKRVPTRLMTRHGWRAKTVERVEADLPRDMFTAPTAPCRTLCNLKVEYTHLKCKK